MGRSLNHCATVAIAVVKQKGKERRRREIRDSGVEGDTMTFMSIYHAKVEAEVRCKSLGGG